MGLYSNVLADLCAYLDGQRAARALTCERADRQRRKKRSGAPSFGRASGNVCERLRARLRREISLSNEIAFGVRGGTPQQRRQAIGQSGRRQVSIRRQMRRFRCFAGPRRPSGSEGI